MSLAPYDVPHVRGDLDVVFQNKTIVGQYRGVGHPIATAIGEYMIDKAAAVMGIEGAELRRRNYLSDAGYPVKTRTGVDLKRFRIRNAWRRLLELIDLPRCARTSSRYARKGHLPRHRLCEFCRTDRNECADVMLISGKQRRRTASRSPSIRRALCGALSASPIKVKARTP